MPETMDGRRLYSDLAWTWPIISPPEEYVDETTEIIEVMSKHSEKPIRRVLNLGCGGGHNDFTLKREFEVTGVDISEAMLSLARKLNPENEYVYGDMRTVRLDRQFDAVTIFDSINYMCSVDDLRAAFRTAYEHLRTGGVLITVADEWREKFIQNKTIHLTRQRGDIEITLIENYYDPNPGDSWYEDNIIFLIRRAGQLKIETDYHRLGLFDLSQWTAAIEAAGFEASQISSSISNGAGEHCPVFVGRRH